MPHGEKCAYKLLNQKYYKKCKAAKEAWMIRLAIRMEYLFNRNNTIEYNEHNDNEIIRVLSWPV